jgi:hypothetical protein
MAFPGKVSPGFDGLPQLNLGELNNVLLATIAG